MQSSPFRMVLLIAAIGSALQQTVPSLSSYISGTNNAGKYCAPYNLAPQYQIRINDYKNACGYLCDQLFGNIAVQMVFKRINIPPSMNVIINNLPFTSSAINGSYMFGPFPWPTDGIIKIDLPTANQKPWSFLYDGASSIDFIVYSYSDSSKYSGNIPVGLAKNTYSTFTSSLTNTVALDSNGCLKLTFTQPCVAMPTTAVMSLESTAFNPTELIADQIGVFVTNTAVQCNLSWNGYRTDATVTCELQNRKLLIRNLFKTASYIGASQKLDICFVKNPLKRTAAINLQIFENDTVRVNSPTNFFISKIFSLASLQSFPFFAQSYSQVSQKVNDPFDVTISFKPLIEFIAKANYSFSLVMPSFFVASNSLNYGLFNVSLVNSVNPLATGVAVYNQSVGTNSATGLNQVVTFLNSPFVFHNGGSIRIWGFKNPGVAGNYQISFRLTINGVEFSQPLVIPITIV
jgi:hypothetical protein